MDHGHIAVLREWWGAHYEINWDFRARVFRAYRRGSETVLEDPSPEALWHKIRQDFARGEGAGER